MTKPVDIIILAGGQGTRMGIDYPKVLCEVEGKTLIDYMVENVVGVGVPDAPVIVVGFQREKVIEHLGDDYRFVIQDEQLGTGHAVAVCRNLLVNRGSNVMVFYGDMPLVSSESIAHILEIHQKEVADLTLATIRVPDFEDWRDSAALYGRMVRDAEGNLQSIVEVKNATEEQLLIKEINPGFYCFDGNWLWENINHLSDDNKQGEFLLTDMLELAVQQGKKVATADVNPYALIGVNTPRQLEILRQELAKK